MSGADPSNDRPALDVVVVVPSIGVDRLLERCVAECHASCPEARIVVVVDDDRGAERLGGVAQVIVVDDVSIAGKRNIGVAATSSELVAFIDSDAYPATGWLQHASRLLRADDGLAAVGGPNVSPPDARGSERFVGMAHRSFLVDGWWTFRKDPRAAARDVVSLPSCNLVVRRTDWDAVGGMDATLFTAEDLDLCSRLVAAGRRIHFSPDVLVFHKDRNLKAFVVQRFVFGVAMVPLWKQRRRAPELSYDLVSVALALFVALVAAGPLIRRVPFLRPWWTAAMTAYGALVTAEGVRVAPRVRDLPGAVLALAVGNLAPGAGVVTMLLHLVPSLDGVYRNDR